MGGSSGGGLLGADDFRRLEELAKQKLAEASGDSFPHVFISFNYEDSDEVNLLRGQAKNDNVDLQFDDYSVKEAIDSTNADYIKRQIREKISRCSVTVVYLSDTTASSAWVNWEIEESIRLGKGVVGVHKADRSPGRIPPALLANGCKVVKWEHALLMKAIKDARLKR